MFFFFLFISVFLVLSLPVVSVNEKQLKANQQRVLFSGSISVLSLAVALKKWRESYRS